MSVLVRESLHTKFMNDSLKNGPIVPRRYTLTHSDLTGELYLTIGQSFNRPQISGWYTRLMRDEVLAEWLHWEDNDKFILHVYCHVSGGIVLGSARWRYRIFKRHLNQVIQTFHYGDSQLVEAHPEIDKAQVVVHFKARQTRYNKMVKRGLFGDYRQEANS